MWVNERAYDEEEEEEEGVFGRTLLPFPLFVSRVPLGGGREVGSAISLCLKRYRIDKTIF